MPGAGGSREQSRLLLALQRTAGNAAVSRLLRQVAPPDAEVERAEAGAPTPLIVADDAQATPGQMRQGDFLGALEPELCSVALARLGDQAQGCPWIRHWIGYYRERDPAEVEQAIARYAPEASTANSAAACIELIRKRVDASIVTWQETGQLTEQAGRSSATVQRAPLQGRERAAGADPAPADVVERLGPGRPLDATVRTGLGAALGADLGMVEVHDDKASAEVVGSLGAAAVTVGRHVAFAAGRYEPGTPLGDALIAHELAHVVQQDAGRRVARDAADPGHDRLLEADADAAAASAMDVLYGGPAARRGVRAAVRSGLSLRACRTKPQAPAFKTAGPTTDLMAGTHTVTATEQADIEAIFQPGSKVVPAPPPVVAPPVGVPAPAPKVEEPPKMDGAGPGGAFEVEMLGFLKGFCKGKADAFKARKAAAPESFAIADANEVAHAAQTEVENYFDKWIAAASRKPADKYHKGTYDLATVLGDQSTRSTTDPKKPNRLGWTGYWMSHGQGRTITDKYHCSYSDRDKGEFTRVRDLFANDPANASDIDDTIHQWPGENSDKVYIQPWADPDPAQKRAVRWDLFTLLLHEMLHSLAHPNYVAAYEALGGTAKELLKEGMVDVMRRDLWDPTGGDLGARLKKPAAEALRTKIEGAKYPLDPGVIKYHVDYENLPDAQELVKKVGLDNCKAAFFLGKVDLLGLSADKKLTVTGTPLTNIASWDPADPANASIYVALEDETVATIALKCGVDAKDITKEDGSALPAGYAPSKGARLRVKGIRYVHAVDGDTLDTLARQNGVTPESIAAANNFAAGSPPATAIAAGTRVLIPHARS